MRKIAIILCAALLFMLTACGTPSPTDVTKSFLDGVKAQDTEAVGNVYEAGGDFALSSKELSDAMIEEGDEGNDILKDFSEDFSAKLLDYDYEITDEKIDGDKATVKVKITTYDFGKEFTSFFNNYISQAMMLTFVDDSDAKLESLEKSLMQTMIDNLKEKTYTGEAELNLSKTDDGWVIDEIDDEGDFMNAITGGTIDSIKNLESIWDE